MLEVVKNAKSENLEYEIYLWISHGYLKHNLCVCVYKVSANFLMSTLITDFSYGYKNFI